MDSKEYELTLNKYKATLHLLKYLEPKYKEKFKNFVGERVWNPESIAYKLFFSKVTNNCNENSSSLRRKMSLFIHPDKCSEPDAQELFCLLEKLSDEEVEYIFEKEDKIEALRQYKNSELLALKKEVYLLESSMWYFYYSMPDIFKDAFYTKEQYEDKIKVLKKQNEELKLENEVLKNFLVNESINNII